MKQLSDEELAVNAQAGSHPCFEELVSRYSYRLYYYLRSRISTPQDTEDLVQETFLKVFRNIGRYNCQYKFSTWLYTTATRLAISYNRKNKTTESVVESATFSSPLVDPPERMIQEENHNNLWETARDLQRHQYRALWLRYVEDLSVKEIARVMNKTQIHVRVLLHRGRQKLMKLVNPAAISEERTGVAPVKSCLSLSE